MKNSKLFIITISMFLVFILLLLIHSYIYVPVSVAKSFINSTYTLHYDNIEEGIENSMEYFDSSLKKVLKQNKIFANIGHFKNNKLSMKLNSDVKIDNLQFRYGDTLVKANFKVCINDVKKRTVQEDNISIILTLKRKGLNNYTIGFIKELPDNGT